MSINNLSNEIFYEIFDYLDACEIYYAFSNLNHRFQQLLYSSSLLFKIKLNYQTPKEMFRNNYKSLIRFHQHQILSIHLTYSINLNPFVSSMIINSLFDCLESIRLQGVKPNILSRFLKKCISLPCLFLLRIDTSNSLKDLNNIYKLVFNLPKLKCLEFTANDFNKFNIKTSLSMATAKQFSPIESLMIDHSCTFNECSTIISYTPQLRNMSVTHLMDNNPNTGIHLPMILSNLTYLFICEYDLEFDQFEMFIRKIDAKLQYLSFNTESEDITYFDAKRWEELIMKYLPQLNKFYFQYHINRDYENEYSVYLDEPDQFISSFWIERQWLFNAEIDYGFILYSIQPYKKQWYEYDSQQVMVNSSTDLSKSSQLSIRYIPPGEYFDLFMTDITRVLNIAEIYYLEITEKNVFIGILVEIIDLLPELLSLKIHSLSLRVQEELCVEKVNVFDLLEVPINITKVYLEKMIEIEEIYFLITLCPDLTYLKVDSINNMDIELFFRSIFMKIESKHNKHFRSMCIRIPAADDKTMNKLQTMINIEKLLINYRIQRMSENIYLQWN